MVDKAKFVAQFQAKAEVKAAVATAATTETKTEESEEPKHVQFPSDFSLFNDFQGRNSTAFEVSLGSLDDPEITVTAQYRPKELQLDQTVPWTKHTNKSNEGKQQLEFSGAEGRGVSLELFFDASEERETEAASVKMAIDALSALASVRDPTSTKDEMKRPHHCVLVFGDVFGPRFRCVIESMSTKYTMFSPFGKPIRATVSLKLREAAMKLSAEDKKEDLSEAKKATAAFKAFFREPPAQKAEAKGPPAKDPSGK
jgi:Contractile injection system tube protein